VVKATEAELLELALLRRRARENFLPWCEYALRFEGKGEFPARHHRLLISYLERVASGEISRLMVLMPPGSAKSTYTSGLFPPWFMMRNPNSSIIQASASLKLATKFSKRVQDYCLAHEPLLGFKPENDNKELWYTTNGCQELFVGVETRISGFRSNLTIIDDPFGSFAEAFSPAQRTAVYQWFREDLMNRQLPDSRIVLVQTRWVEDDLAGRLLQDEPEEWVVLKLPQIAGENDPMGRSPGEYLWPEFETPEKLAKKRKSIGERSWAALHQQDPRPQGGSLFDVGKLRTIPLAPSGRRIRAWDLAATEQIGTRDPDYTAGALLCMAQGNTFVPERTLVIEDMVRDRGGPGKIERLIVETAQRDGKDVTIFLPKDPAQAGVWQVSYLTRQLHGYNVVIERPSGNKATRAMPVASQMEAGNVAMVQGAWNRAFKDELEVFPAGAHDDQVDAVSGGYAVLLGPDFGNGVSVQKLGY
jgi:predicted phage terminase large subunit-like protein